MAAPRLNPSIAAAELSIVHNEPGVETFDQYYQRDYRSLVGLAFLLCGSRWAAEDLVQDALTEAHRNWTKVAAYDDTGAWVRRVLVNKHSSRGRRLRTEAKGMLRLASRRDATTIDPTEPTGEIWSVVRTLPTRQAQAIALYYWEDRPIKDIAEILGTSQETAKTHLKRARAALSTSLRDHWGDAGS